MQSEWKFVGKPQGAVATPFQAGSYLGYKVLTRKWIGTENVINVR